MYRERTEEVDAVAWTHLTVRSSLAGVHLMLKRLSLLLPLSQALLGTPALDPMRTPPSANNNKEKHNTIWSTNTACLRIQKKGRMPPTSKDENRKIDVRSSESMSAVHVYTKRG